MSDLSDDAIRVVDYLVQYNGFDKNNKISIEGIYATSKVRAELFLLRNNKVIRNGVVYFIHWENMKGGIWCATLPIHIYEKTKEDTNDKSYTP